ncbi:hypothetical protein G9A89_017774 [Geosiphon pyriformis]|nr:hypothetical protein G9A89_017774 [Geosiphon pyriformis]
MPVLKETNLCWFHLVSINAGYSLELKPTPLVSLELNDRFATLKCSFASLAEHVNKLAKKLDTLGLMIINKFEGVHIFTSGLDSKFLGTGVAVIMNNFLAQHVFKMEEMPGHVISVQLLFKGKLLVMILDLVASTSDFFNTDHKTVMVLVGLEELLDFHLNELLVAKVVKSLQSGDFVRTALLLNAWFIADKIRALEVQNMLDNGVSRIDILSCLFRIKKSYHCSKMHESRTAQSAAIRFKRQESVYDYRIDTKFVAKMSRINNVGGVTFFFTARAFVDNTIWIGNSQSATQFILDIVSEFFLINNISVNNDKTIAILINKRVKDATLRISGFSILIARHSVLYKYLDIFLSTDGLFKPNLAKV